MRAIGYHTSVSKGWTAAAKEVSQWGANSFQFFTRNPRGSKAKAIDLEDLRLFQETFAYFGPIFAHGAYTMNLASSKEAVRQRSVSLLIDDMARMAVYPEETIYVFHPGSHTGDGIDLGIQRIIKGLDIVLPHLPNRAICLETMSGKGSEVGGRFEEIQAILSALADDRLGVVLDTCHLFSAGYDISKPEEVLEEVDKTFGICRIKGIHVNDSLTPFGAKKDRHASVGDGEIGLDALARFLGHPALSHLPLALETPGEGKDHAEEIAALRARL